MFNFKIKNDVSILCDVLEKEFNTKKSNDNNKFDYNEFKTFIINYIKKNNIIVEKLYAECEDCSARELYNITISTCAFFISLISLFIPLFSDSFFKLNDKTKICPYIIYMLLIIILSVHPLNVYTKNRNIDRWKCHIKIVLNKLL